VDDLEPGNDAPYYRMWTSGRGQTEMPPALRFTELRRRGRVRRLKIRERWPHEIACVVRTLHQLTADGQPICLVDLPPYMDPRRLASYQLRREQ